MSSTFDENHNITGVIKKSAEDRPLAEYLSSFKNSLYWLLMVAKNVKKIYYPNDMVAATHKYKDAEFIPENSDLFRDF